VLRLRTWLLGSGKRCTCTEMAGKGGPPWLKREWKRRWGGLWMRRGERCRAVGAVWCCRATQRRRHSEH